MSKYGIVMLLWACGSLSNVKAEEEVASRYGLVLLALDGGDGIPDIRKGVRTGLEVVIDGEVISVGSLTYWASMLSPANNAELELAKSYLRSDRPELRIIVAWAILESIGITKADFPEGISPMWAGKKIESKEFSLFSKFLLDQLEKRKKP